MQLELRIVYRGDKEVLQQRYRAVRIEIPPFWKLFADVKVDVVHSEWTDVPYERE